MVPWLRSGVGEQHKEWQKETIWPVGSKCWSWQHFLALKCPRHSYKVQCILHYTVQCFKHLQVLCPRHHKSSLHSCLFLCLCRTFFQPVCRLLGQGSKVSHTVKVHRLQTDPGLQWCDQQSPDVNWAEPPSTQQTFTVLCYGTVHCRFVFLCLAMVRHTAGIGLLAVVAKSYGCCCFLPERNHFLYDFVVGLQPAGPLLAAVAMPLSPAIDPTLGASFVVVGFRPPLWRVGCCALGLQQYTETNTLIDGNRRFIVLDQDMVLWKLSTSTQKEALQNGCTTEQ